MSELRVWPDRGSLARAAAEHFISQAAQAVAARGRFTVALSGGSTPQPTYRLLASPEFAPRVDWPRVHVFWGDERCVPPDHPDSNYRMAREVLLDHIPLPGSNVHRMRGELEPQQAASAYERALRSFFAGHPTRPFPRGSGRREPRPYRFDLILLGMGNDGHTASLFPGTAALHERSRWVIAHYVHKLSAWRVTLTPVVINAAAQVTFLVSGADKAERLQEVLAGPYQPDLLPAQIVRPTDGSLLWLVDAAAAARLEGAGQDAG